jgi:hypothetical protein
MNKKELMLLSIGIFLTVIAWLIADIIHASTEEKLKSKIELPKIIQYDISEDLLEVLEKKKE